MEIQWFKLFALGGIEFKKQLEVTWNTRAEKNRWNSDIQD